jgi:hypothetical protein
MSSALTYDYTGTIVTYTVPVTATYDIIAFGAQGGGDSIFAGGLGAEVSVVVTLTAGSVLDILVGGQGAAGSTATAVGGGGGGGSFVAEANGTSTPTLLAAAGGGGGAFDAGFGAAAGTNASIGPQGTTPAGGNLLGDTGGSNGSGGSVGQAFLGGAGGGGGFTGNGQSGGGGGGGGGLSFTAYLSGQTNPYAGGFGGGGQGAAVFGSTGGGGGGYSGGGAGADGGMNDAAAPGGGGGSFFTLDAKTVTLTNGAQAGNGEVEISMACFLRGTRIATPGGEVAVQTLRAGDRVLTADGRAVPLVWTGRQRVRAATPLDRALHYPVRVRADAVAPGAPRRDLLVTGDHALFIDGRLIPARLLVNGASIVAEREMTDFTYFHLELGRHDLLLAEGLPAESYLDNGNRYLLSAETISTVAPTAYGTAVQAYEAAGVAPLALHPAVVEPVWRRLAGRAAALGLPVAFPSPATAAGPGLHLLADGRRIPPSVIHGDRWLFAVPAGSHDIRLACRAARPSDVRPWLDDRRRLGVNVRRVRLLADCEATDIALDSPRLAEGWHAVERTGPAVTRWTAGEARLLLPPGTGPALLVLTIAAAMADEGVDQLAA